MRILKRPMLAAFPQRVFNIHPSLLPSFPGMEAWKQALSYGVKVTGCTVHLVDEGTDTGPIILQRAVPVLADDTPEVLHARIQVEEHVAYPQALQLLAEGRLHVEGRRVRVS
jgi:phosphoribosylglycinamide formyltransferase-1